MSTEGELAWAAGLFEGEGCFSFNRYVIGARDGISLRAMLSMTDEDVVCSFARIMGFGRTRIRPYKLRPDLKTRYEWRANGPEALHTYTMLEPWLHQRRRERWAELLSARREYEKKIPEILRDRDRRSAAARRRHPQKEMLF